MEEQQRKEEKKRLVKRLYFAVSLCSAFCSAVALWYYNVSPYWSEGFFGRETLITVGILFSAVYVGFAKMYDAHKVGLFRLQELTFSQMLSFGMSDFSIMIAMFFWFHDIEHIRFRIFALIFFLQLLVIAGITFCCNRLYARYDTPRKILIVFGEAQYERFLKKIKEKPYRYHVEAMVSEKEPMEKLLKLYAICKDAYLLGCSERTVNAMVRFADTHGKDIHISFRLQDLLTMRYEVSHSFDTPFLRNRKTEVMWYYPILKRGADLVLSFLALLLLSPVLLVTAVSVWIYDRGPVFYAQERLTEGGKRFRIYKFRSMRVDAEKEGARLASVKDSRITPVGEVIRKLRIDELPQLWNILKGDMTIVGPRPERPEIAEEYEKVLPEFRLRLKVKAGLTGYAQVYGKYNTTPEDKLKLDLIYIAERSVLFDLRIMFYTLKIIFIPESTEGVSENQKTAI